MMATEGLARQLWRDNRDLAEACLGHPFVRGLADGTLDRQAFRRYVGQDAFFLRTFARAYALAAARSAELPTTVRLHRLLGGVLEELDLHAGYAQELGIDLEGVAALPATSAYTDFLLATAWGRPLGEILAAMTPCMRLYAWLGRELAPGGADNPYQDWIDTYSSDGFEALAGSLEQLLDETTTASPHVRDAYRYALRCELDFFDTPLRREA